MAVRILKGTTEWQPAELVKYPMTLTGWKLFSRLVRSGFAQSTQFEDEVTTRLLCGILE